PHGELGNDRLARPRGGRDEHGLHPPERLQSLDLERVELEGVLRREGRNDVAFHVMDLAGAAQAPPQSLSNRCGRAGSSRASSAQWTGPPSWEMEPVSATALAARSPAVRPGAAGGPRPGRQSSDGTISRPSLPRSAR